MTEAPRTVEHQWCDAWLLIAAALASAEAPASLRAIIAAADAIQHAVPEFEELDGALARLSVAGLLHRSDRGFALTVRGTELVARHPGARLHQQKALEKTMSAAPWSERYVPQEAGRGSFASLIDRGEYSAAVKSYVQAQLRVAA
jgi:hypothetical protein